MSRVRGPSAGECGMPGPYTAHCTDYPGHRYSCYDASEDVAFNGRQDFHHECDVEGCRSFDNVGD